MTKRIILIAALAAVAVTGVWSSAFAQAPAQQFTGEQYKKALWMMTRFYGGQRAGEGPNWILMGHPNPQYRTSFENETLNGQNVSGGWFDCGDHILYGQTFFFSAYLLAKAYEMFPTGFHDLYHGFDYSDYAAANDWSMAGGQPDGIPDLLQELKYATDWIIKATPNNNTFIWQVGDNRSHWHWGTAGYQSANFNTGANWNGGTPRPIYTNPSDGVMASYAAATLALMSQLYRPYDAAYADLALQHARHAYAYASANRNNNRGSTDGNYPAHKHPATVFNVAAAELYRATEEQTFRNAINVSNLQADEWNHNWIFDYSNSHDIVMLAVAQALPEQRNAILARMKELYIDKYTGSQLNAQGVSTRNSGWGELRYPANYAFIVALYQAMVGGDTYDRFIYNQLDFILGKNPSNRSFVIGFGPAEGIANEVTMPHHRNVLLNDLNLSHAEKEQQNIRIPPRNRYFGYLVGGRVNTATFVDNYQEYQASEGGLDYNAGMVGALGYIVSKLAPFDTSGVAIVPPTCDPGYVMLDGQCVPVDPQDPQCPEGEVWDDDIGECKTSIRYAARGRRVHGGLSHQIRGGAIVFTSHGNADIANVSLYNLQGRRIYTNRAVGSRSVSISTQGRARGVYVAQVEMSDGRVLKTNLLLR